MRQRGWLTPHLSRKKSKAAQPKADLSRQYGHGGHQQRGVRGEGTKRKTNDRDRVKKAQGVTEGDPHGTIVKGAIQKQGVHLHDGRGRAGSLKKKKSGEKRRQSIKSKKAERWIWHSAPETQMTTKEKPLAFDTRQRYD